MPGRSTRFRTNPRALAWTPRRSLVRTLVACFCGGLSLALAGFILAVWLSPPSPPKILPLGGVASSPPAAAPTARRLVLDPLLAAMTDEIRRQREANRALREELDRTLAERDALRRERAAAAERERAARQPPVSEPEAPRPLKIAPAMPPEPDPAGAPPTATVAPASPAPAAAAPTPPVASATAPADALRAGVAAYRAGEYEQAMALWRPLAERGVAKAQFHLAALYLEGRVGGRALQAAWRWAVRARDGGYAPAAALLKAIEAQARAQGGLPAKPALAPAVPGSAALPPCRFAGGCPSHPG
jgi:hypothetical protein